jgi:hypothetical protein
MNSDDDEKMYKKKYLKYKMKYLSLQRGSGSSQGSRNRVLQERANIAWTKANTKEALQAAEDKKRREERNRRKQEEIDRFEQSLGTVRLQANKLKNSIRPNIITAEETEYLCDFKPEFGFTIATESCNKLFGRDTLYDKMFTDIDIDVLLKAFKISSWDHSKLEKLNLIKEWIKKNIDNFKQDIKIKYSSKSKYPDATFEGTITKEGKINTGTITQKDGTIVKYKDGEKV